MWVVSPTKVVIEICLRSSNLPGTKLFFFLIVTVSIKTYTIKIFKFGSVYNYVCKQNYPSEDFSICFDKILNFYLLFFHKVGLS